MRHAANPTQKDMYRTVGMSSFTEMHYCCDVRNELLPWSAVARNCSCPRS